MAHQKRIPAAAPTKTVEAWKLPADQAALAVLLWGRANRLRNLLEAATSREEAMAAAVAYLRSVGPIVVVLPLALVDGPLTVAATYLRDATTDRFAAEAAKLAFPAQG